MLNSPPPYDQEEARGSHGSTEEFGTGAQGGISSVRYSGPGVGMEDVPVSQAASSSNVMSIAKNRAARMNIVVLPTATYSVP